MKVFKSLFSKSIGHQGLAQIPIIIGLLIMAIAIPVATRLSQQEQDIRQLAACPSSGTSCSGSVAICCNSFMYYCAGNVWQSSYCNNGCNADGTACNTACDYQILDPVSACGVNCPVGQRKYNVRTASCSIIQQCLQSSSCPVPTTPPNATATPVNYTCTGGHPDGSNWCNGSESCHCGGGMTTCNYCYHGCDSGTGQCRPAPPNATATPTITRICTPGDIRCDPLKNSGNGVQEKCNSGGTDWVFVMNCVTGCDGKLCDTYVTNTPRPTNTSIPSSTPTNIPTRIPTRITCPSVGSSCSTDQVSCCQDYLYICTGGQWRSERCLTGCKDTQTCNISCDYSILMDTCSDCGANGDCLSGQKKCTVQKTDCGTNDECINFPSQCASDTTPTPIPTSPSDGSCSSHPNYSTWCQNNSQRGYCLNGISYFNSCSWGCLTESSIKASCKLSPTSAPNQPTPTLVCNPNAPVCKDNKQYRCNAIGTDMTFVHNCADQCNGNLCNAYITNTPAPTCNGICKLYSPSTGFSSCSNYGMETSTGTCETGICCKYPPAYTCKSPNICRDTGGGRANCASYGQTDTSGTCPQGQVCCANKPTLPPSPTPTISNTKCSFDGKQYSVDAEICGSGGLFSRCKDGQKCTCGSDGKWQVVTCPSGSCQAGKCTQPCLFQGQYYGPDKTVCDTANNKAGTCSHNGQWIWINCGSVKYCQDGLCLPKTCCCIRSVSTNISSVSETCQLYSGSSCGALSSLSSPAYQADPSKCQSSQTSSVSSPTPTIAPTSTPAINPSGVTEGGYCTGSMPVWCGGIPAKQYICTGNTWRSVATCTNGCLGNRCTEVVNNCDYIILERKGQCGSYCPNLNEIQFKVQTGKRLADGSCEIAYRCYPRAECTVNTGCTNGQLNDAKWCFAGQPCTCQNGKIECGEYCTYGCLDGNCGTPETVDQIKFTSNLTTEDFFTLNDQELIIKHCQNKGGTPDQVQNCLSNTDIENLLKDLDPNLESTIMDLRQATLRKLDYLNMDRQSLAQKYCNGIQSCMTSFNPDSLLSGLTPQEIESIKQQKANLEIQTKIQDFMALNQQDLLSKYCQSNLSCINSFTPESLLSGLSQTDRDRLIKQKQAAEILSHYQNTSLVSANTNISAEEERYLVGKCLELGGSCQDKQSALAFLLKLSSPDQSDSNYSYFLTQLEDQKQLRQDELDAYNRIAKTLTNLGIINPYTGLLDPKYQGQSFVELEQKLIDLRSTDPAINAVIIYNNLTAGAAKRGIDIAYASDATTWDFIRGNLTYAAPAGGMAAGIGALALAPLAGSAALTYLGTGMGISGTVNSLSYTAETCGGDNMDSSKCAMAVARTTFMAASTGIGVVSSSANLISQSTTNSGLLGLTGRLGTSSFATGTGIKVANTLVSGAGTGIFGVQTVQSYQQEGLSFNTFVNASIALTSAGRFASSLAGQSSLSAVAQTTTTTVDNTSDLIQATVSCTSATSDMTRVEDCIRDMVALLNDASQLGQSPNARRTLQDTIDQTTRGNIANSDPINRYLTEIAQRTSLDIDTEINKINDLRQAQLASNPDDIDGINARFDQQIEAYKTTQSRQIYDTSRLLGRIQEDGLNIVLADDQGIPRPIVDVQKEVETILAQRNPIIRDYQQQTKATIDQMDEPTLLKFISDNALPARIIDTDGNRLDLDGLRKSVADAYSVKATADARLIADAVIKANDAGQSLTYRNPDGTFKPLSDIIPPKSADIAQAEQVKQPDQPDVPVAPKSPNILDKIAGFFRPAPPSTSDIKPAEVPFTHQDLNRLADNISQGHVTVKPSTDDQGNPVYRLTTQASASQETIDTVDRLNKVISDFEGSFGHPIRQNQLDLLLKPESIRQLQAGGGKTTVMAHLEAIARRNVIFAMPNQTDAESFVRDVQARSDFYVKQGLEVVYYDSNRGFLSIDGDFNIAKARQIDFDQISKMANAAQADPTRRGFIIVTTSADNAWGTIRGRQNTSPTDKFIYEAVFGSRDFHLVVDEIGSVVQGEYSVSQGKPAKLSQITDSNQIYGYKKVSDLISASTTVDNIDQVKKLLSQVQEQLSQGGSNRDLFFEWDGITRPYPKDPGIVNSSYASLIDAALVRANGKISPQFEAELRAIAQKLTDPSIDSEAARKLFTDTLQKVQQGDDASVLTDLSYMTSYLQSKWHIMSMVPGNDFGLESGDLVIRKLGGTSGEKFSQITDLIAMQTDGLAMLRSAGIDIGEGIIAPIGDITYTPDSFKISNLEILRAKAASGKLAGYDATPDTAARAIGVLATDPSERPKNPTNFAVDKDMAQLIKKGIDTDYMARHQKQALAVVIADDGVSYQNTTDAFLSRQMELRDQDEITLARTKYKTELEGDQKTEYFFETVTRNADGTVIRKITDTFTDQDSWGTKIHQFLAQDPQKIAIVFEGRTRAVDLKVEETSKLVAWTVIASDSNTMEDITQAWKRNRVAAGTGAAETWDDAIKAEFSQYSLLVRSGNADLTADNIIDIYQTRLIEKLARDNFDTTLRQIAETPKSGIDTVRALLSDRSDFTKISADLDTVLTNVDRVIRASVTEIFYKPLDSDQIADVVYNRGQAVYDQLKAGVDTIVDQYKLTTQEAEVIRRQLGIDEPYIARTTFDNILSQPSRNPDLSLIGPSGLVRNWAMTNSESDLPKYAWAQSADADTVAIQTEVIRQSIVQKRLVDVQTRVNQIADSLGRLEIPRGYDITTGLTANFLQTTLGLWSGKDIATAVSHISSQVNSGQITTQATLTQALQLNLTPLIDDTVLRQSVIDSIMSGPVAQSLKTDDIASSATANQTEEPAQVQQSVEQQPAEEPVTVPAQAQVSQDTIDKANTLRTTSKGSQESVEDYTNRINSLWQERQQLIDVAQALHLDLQASVGDQPWSTFKTRATSYISQAQKLNQQAQDISLDLGTGLLTLSDMSAAIKAKQAEIDTQRQAAAEADRLAQEAAKAQAEAQAKQQAEQVAKALADAKQKAKSDYGITASGLTIEQVQQQVDQIKKEIDQLQTDSGLTFRSDNPSESFAAFKTRAQTEIANQAKQKAQAEAQAKQAEEEAKAIKALTGNIHTQLQDIDTTSNNPDTLQKSLDSLTEIQQQLQSNPLYQTNSDLQQLNTDIQSQIDQTQDKITSLQTEVDQPKQPSLPIPDSFLLSEGEEIPEEYQSTHEKNIDAWGNIVFQSKLDRTPNPRYLDTLKQVSELWKATIEGEQQQLKFIGALLSPEEINKLYASIDTLSQYPELYKLSNFDSYNPWIIAQGSTLEEKIKLLENYNGRNLQYDSFLNTPAFKRIVEISEKIRLKDSLSQSDLAFIDALSIVHQDISLHLDADYIHEFVINPITRRFILSNLVERFLVRQLVPSNALNDHQSRFELFKQTLENRGITLPDWFSGLQGSELSFGLQISPTLPIANAVINFWFRSYLTDTDYFGAIIDHENVHRLIEKSSQRSYFEGRTTDYQEPPDSFTSEEIYTEAMTLIIRNNGNIQAALEDNARHGYTYYHSGVHELLKILLEVNHTSADEYMAIKLMIQGFSNVAKESLFYQLELWYDQNIAVNEKPSFSQRMFDFSDEKLYGKSKIEYSVANNTIQDFSYTRSKIRQISPESMQMPSLDSNSIEGYKRYYLDYPYELLYTSVWSGEARDKFKQTLLADDQVRQELSDWLIQYYQNLSHIISRTLENNGIPLPLFYEELKKPHQTSPPTFVRGIVDGLSNTFTNIIPNLNLYLITNINSWDDVMGKVTLLRSTVNLLSKDDLDQYIFTPETSVSDFSNDQTNRLHVQILLNNTGLSEEYALSLGIKDQEYQQVIDIALSYLYRYLQTQPLSNTPSSLQDYQTTNLESQAKAIQTLINNVNIQLQDIDTTSNNPDTLQKSLESLTKIQQQLQSNPSYQTNPDLQQLNTDIQSQIDQTQDKISSLQTEVSQQLQQAVDQPPQLALPAPQQGEEPIPQKSTVFRTPEWIKSIIDSLSQAAQSAQQSFQVATTTSITAWIKINEILTTINQKVSSMTATDFSSYQCQETMTKDDFISQNQPLIVALFESSGLTADLRSTSGITDQEFESYIQGLGGQLYQKIKEVNQLKPFTLFWHQGPVRTDVVNDVANKIVTALPTVKPTNLNSGLNPVSTSDKPTIVYRVVYGFSPGHLQSPPSLRFTDLNPQETEAVRQIIIKNPQVDLRQALIFHKDSSYSGDPFLSFSIDKQTAIELYAGVSSNSRQNHYLITASIPTNRLYSIDSERGSFSNDQEYSLMQSLDPSWVTDIQYLPDLEDDSLNEDYTPLGDLTSLTNASNISQVLDFIDLLINKGFDEYQGVKLSKLKSDIAGVINGQQGLDTISIPIFRRKVEQILFKEAGYNIPSRPIIKKDEQPTVNIPQSTSSQSADSSAVLAKLNHLLDFSTDTLLTYKTGLGDNLQGYVDQIKNLISAGNYQEARQMITRLKIEDIGQIFTSSRNQASQYISDYNLQQASSSLDYQLRSRLEEQNLDSDQIFDLIRERFFINKSIPAALLFGNRSDMVDTRLGEELTYEVASYLSSRSQEQNKQIEDLLLLIDNLEQSQPAQTQSDSDLLASQISQLESQLGIRSAAKFDYQTGIPISTDNPIQRFQDLSILSKVRHIYSQIQTSLQTYLVNYLSQQINTLLSSKSFSSPEQLQQFISQVFDQKFTLIKTGRHPRPYDDNQTWLWNTVALQIVALDADKQLSDSQVRSITNQLAMSFSISQKTYYQSIIDNLSYQTSQASNIFATSDIHGDWDQFVKLASQTKPDSPAVLDKKGNWIAPQGTRLLVLGDMLDRAPKGKHSYQVVENMMNLQKQAGKDPQGNDNVVVLMGNHELIMLKVLDIFGNMLNNGFKKQEAANIASSPNVSGFGFNIDPQDILYLYDHPDLVSWIKSLPFIIQVGNSLYFHSNSYDYRNFGSSIDEINTNLRLVVENGSHQIKNPLTDSTKPITISDLAELITQGDQIIIDSSQDRDPGVLTTTTVDQTLATFGIDLTRGKIIHGHDQREGMTGRTLDPRVINVDSGMSLYYSASSDRGTFKIVDQNTTITNASINTNQVVSFDPDGCSSCALVRRKVEDFIDQAKKKGKDAIEWTWAFGAANDHDFRNDPEQFELNFLIWLHSFFVRQDKSSLRMANLWGQRTTDVILELITQGGLDPLSLIDLNFRLARVEQQLSELKDLEASPSSPLVVVKDNLIELKNLFNRTFGQSTSDTASDLSLDLPFTNNPQTTIDEFSSLVGKDFWQAFNNLPDDTNFFHIQDIGSTTQVWSLDLNDLLKNYEVTDDLIFETFNLADLKSFIQENNLDLKTIIAPDMSNPLSFLLIKRQILPPLLIKTYLMTDDGAWIEASLHLLDNVNTLSPLPGDIYYFSTNIEHIDNYFYVFYHHHQNSFIFLNYGPSWFGIKTGARELQTDDTFNLFGKTFEYKILPDGSIQITISNPSPLTFDNYFLPCQGEDGGGVLNLISNLGSLSSFSIFSTNSPLKAFV